MNRLERDIIEVLRKLKNEYGAIEVKAEYENEGSRQEELLRLRDVCGEVELPIIIKIGGVEAVTDMYNAILLGAEGIIAPMAETKFAVRKFLSAIETFIAEDTREDIEFAINIETITAFRNIDDILSLPEIRTLSGVTIGRADFTASLEKEAGFADSDEMLGYCAEILRKCRDKGLRTGLGGSITARSERVIKPLVDQNLLDKYETRKLVYAKDSVKNLANGVRAGLEFEILWLENKRGYYHRISNEDEKRIEALRTRLNA